MIETKRCSPTNAIGIVTGKIATITPKTGDFAHAASVAEVKSPTKIPYRRSLAKILAQRRTVSETMRAVMLMISTGKISGESQGTGPAKCFRYPTGPWCLMPCQLKYKKVRIAHARGTETCPVGEVNTGRMPSELENKTNTEMELTKGMSLA